MIDIMHHPLDASTYDLLVNDKFIRQHFTVITLDDLDEEDNQDDQ